MPAPADGYVQAIDALAIGVAASLLGAGRETKDDVIDPAVGVVLKKKVGDAVRQGEPLAELHINRKERAEEAQKLVSSAFTVGAEPVAAPTLLHGVVTEAGIARA